MSVAPEFPPIVDIPECARRTMTGRPARPPHLRLVRYEQPAPTRPPLRLTTSGLLVASVLVGVLLTGIAALSAPSGSSATGPGGDAPAPAIVTVRDGETLWSIAGRIAPDRDPRSEVSALIELNDLPGPALVPGQLLRTR